VVPVRFPPRDGPLPPLSLFVLDVFFWENMVLYVLFFELGRRTLQESRSLAPR